jgi:hypothetical protein
VSKNFKKIDIIAVLVLIGLIAGFYVFNFGQVQASPGTVEFTSDVELDLTGLDTTIYIASGSKADSLTISGTDLNVYGIWAGTAFLLKTATYKILQLIPSGGTANLTFSSSYVSSGYVSQWAETSSVSVVHIVGVPSANTDYIVKVGGVPYGTYNSGPSAELSFTRTGSGFSEVFTVEENVPPPPPAPPNVSGWAWSSNIGWISFNCTDRDVCGSSDYGVDIGSDGTFSGYAWSENIGWISFNESELSGCPASPCKTQVSFGNGEVSGWARALSYGDGWDGWIKMRDGSYGVSINFSTGDFSGFAWGSDVVGWISFSGSNYKVITSFVPPPSISNLGNAFSPCVQSRIPTFSWETDAEIPYDYEIRLCGNSDCTGPGDPLVSELKGNTSSTSWSPACTYTCNISPYNNIAFGGGTYYGQVEARNLGGEWSGWASSAFTTYIHAYPYADFLCDGINCAGMEIDEEVVVSLTNNSTTYDGVLGCSWDLPAIAEVLEGNPLSDCTLKVKFSAPAPGQREQNITFTVTDSNNYSCSATKTVTIQFPLPEYKEVPPIIWLKNFFAGIVEFFNGFLKPANG